ncbi:MAG: Zn-dependent hydrolase [Acidobacteriota bacterium]
MNRRDFNRKLLGLTGAMFLHPPSPRPRSYAWLRVNGPRSLEHLESLAELGKTPEGGISRIAYSDADREARSYVMELMGAAGLETEIDVAGNILGRRGGREPDLPPLMLGSHIDSVPDGGNYDGQVGSIGAIEVAQTLLENRVTPRHPLEVVIFQNEEGGKTGSRAISGEVTEKELDLVTRSGKTIREGIAFLGGDPDHLDRARRRRGDIAAYLELHIEQGAVLETEGIDIGVVEGIVGIKRWNVTIRGFANHAGTTPMDQRQDALWAAAMFIVAVRRIVTTVPGRHVGTVGQIQAFPGAPNVIPGRAVLSLELRDLDMRKIETLYGKIRDAGLEIGRRTSTEFDFDEFYVSRAAPTDKRLRRLIAEAAQELGLSRLRMPSGAGHDAQSIASLAPVGMIFIPSVGGISHSPRELSRPEDIVSGMNVLLHTLLKLDALSLD